MDFEAPTGSAAEWLNTGKYVARRVLNESAKTFTLRVYDVSDVAVDADAANVTRIAKPVEASLNRGTSGRRIPRKSPAGNLSSNPSA